MAPSHKDIMHFFPMPQPAFSKDMLPQNLKNEFVLVGNPGLIEVNDLKIGFCNTDIIKDLIQNVVVRLPEHEKGTSKIDMVIEQIVTQRSFYPLYPINPELAVELS